jgi:NAD-dependent deacetylase
MTAPLDFSPHLLEKLRAARHVAVLTGAGISAESGVPTFRDAQTGLWARFDPLELASPQAFARDPRLVWEWYAWRRDLVAGAQPNPGHHALAALARRVPQLTLITQNVDNLHQAAGSADVIELHGNIQRIKCSRDGAPVDEWVDTGEVPPRCPLCGAYLRPDVVWFGESLPAPALFAAVAAARDCDVFFAIGTSALVQPAASLPLEALQRGAVVVEINPEATPLTHAVTYALAGPAGQVLPALLAAAWPNG